MNKIDNQKKLSHVLSALNPDCEYMKDWLGIHVPKCEYCQGFIVGLLEIASKYKWQKLNE